MGKAKREMCPWAKGSSLPRGFFPSPVLRQPQLWLGLMGQAGGDWRRQWSCFYSSWGSIRFSRPSCGRINY